MDIAEDHSPVPRTQHAAWLRVCISRQVPADLCPQIDRAVRLFSCVQSPAAGFEAIAAFRIRQTKLRITLCVTRRAKGTAFETALLALSTYAMQPADLARSRSLNIDEAMASSAAQPKHEVGGEQWNDDHDRSVPQLRVFRIHIQHARQPPIRRGRDQDTELRLQETMQGLQQTGRYRPLALPHPQWHDLLTKLAIQLPNFGSVIHCVIQPHLQLLMMGVPHRMAPVLLVGGPGIGKTMFADKLAEIMGLKRPLFVSMAGDTMGATLAGSAHHWSNSNPGAIFDVMAWPTATGRAVANPLVVLDELDKAQGNGPSESLGALYALLEPVTAARFRDMSLPDLLIDASRLRWVATANDAASIPQPIQSRFRIFDIEPPTHEQRARIAQGIYRGLVKEYGLHMSEELRADIVADAANLVPRAIRMTLESAIASAMSRGAPEVAITDWLTAKSPASAPKQRMGF